MVYYHAACNAVLVAFICYVRLLLLSVTSGYRSYRERNSELCLSRKFPFRVHFNQDVVAGPLTEDICSESDYLYCVIYIRSPAFCQSGLARNG